MEPISAPLDPNNQLQHINTTCTHQFNTEDSFAFKRPFLNIGGGGGINSLPPVKTIDKFSQNTQMYQSQHNTTHWYTPIRDRLIMNYETIIRTH